MVMGENGKKPEPLTVTIVPAGPSEGVSSIAGAAIAIPTLERKPIDEINKATSIENRPVDIWDALPDSPNTGTSLLEIYVVAFKVNIIVITEPRLHFSKTSCSGSSTDSYATWYTLCRGMSVPAKRIGLDALAFASAQSLIIISHLCGYLPG